MEAYASLAFFNRNSSRKADSVLRVHSIQEDAWRKTGSIIFSIGSALYTISHGNPSPVLLAGNPLDSGWRNGPHLVARFNQTTSFAQLPNGMLIVSDTNNRCLRTLNRESLSVSTFAGLCQDRTRYYNDQNYRMGQVFNKPTTLQYDPRTGVLYLLDAIGFSSNIIARNMRTSLIKWRTVLRSYQAFNNFIHDSFTNSFTLVSGRRVINMTTTREVTDSTVNDPFGLALHHSILMVTNKQVAGFVQFIDYQRGDSVLFNLCAARNSPEGLPICMLVPMNPTAIAVIGGYLYIGSTFDGTTNSLTGTNNIQASLQRVQFSTDNGM